MTDITFSSQIIEILNNLAERFGIFIDWTDQNIIPYLTEITNKVVNYEFYSRIYILGILSLICISFIIPSSLIIFKLYKNKQLDMDNDPISILWFVILILSLFVLFIVIVIFFLQLPTLIACKVFPEKIVFNYISELINGG